MLRSAIPHGDVAEHEPRFGGPFGTTNVRVTRARSVAARTCVHHVWFLTCFFLDGPKHEPKHGVSFLFHTHIHTPWIHARVKSGVDPTTRPGGEDPTAPPGEGEVSPSTTREFLLQRGAGRASGPGMFTKKVNFLGADPTGLWRRMAKMAHAASGREAHLLRGVTRRSDRGYVEEVVRNLERRSRAVDLRETGKKSALLGRWKLLYSNALPRGPMGRSYDAVGEAYQVLYEGGKKVDHEVEFNVGDQGRRKGLTSGWLDNALPNDTVGAVLKHKCRIDMPRTVTITLETVRVGLGETQLELPTLPEFLQPPDWTRSSSFDVTYLDEGLRVTRGDRGELRVFLREG